MSNCIFSSCWKFGILTSPVALYFASCIFFTCASLNYKFPLGRTSSELSGIAKLYITMGRGMLLKRWEELVIDPDCYQLLTRSLIMHDNSLCLIQSCFYVQQEKWHWSQNFRAEITKTVYNLRENSVFMSDSAHERSCLINMFSSAFRNP